jgi:hypothetical protein
MDKSFKWHMLITAFTPLWCSIIVIFVFDFLDMCFISWYSFLVEKWPEIILLLFILISFPISFFSILSFIKIKKKPREETGEGTIIHAKKSNMLVSNFLITYILPMLAFNYKELHGIILFAIYFSVLVYLSIRNNNVYTNIIFEFMHFRMYSCKIKRIFAGEEYIFNDCIVISKENLTSKSEYLFPFFDFENDIYINLQHLKDGK